MIERLPRSFLLIAQFMHNQTAPAANAQSLSEAKEHMECAEKRFKQ